METHWVHTPELFVRIEFLLYFLFLVVRASLEKRSIVTRKVVGSNPTDHPF
jgi:hypothetical protein